mgnify:CR=1 FL=1
MSELFWFLLGVFTYKLLVALIHYGYRIAYLTKIKFLAFLLIGRAYQEVLFVQHLKYNAIREQTADEEKVKLHKNSDELFLEEWKKNAIAALNSSLPLPYQNTIDIADWKQLMDVMDNYYKEKMRGINREEPQD